MGLFNKEKEGKEQRILRLIEENCNKHFMIIEGEDLDSEDLEILYRRDWDFISASDRYLGDSKKYFKKLT